MTTRTTTRLKDVLLACENEYLRAVQDKDGEAAARLTAPQSLVVSGRGAMKVDGEAIRRMVQQHDANRQYAIDESSVQVVQPAEDVAIIAYRLRTKLPGGGTADAYDTDVWVRRDGGWACALHVEVPAEAA